MQRQGPGRKDQVIQEAGSAAAREEQHCDGREEQRHSGAERPAAEVLPQRLVLRFERQIDGREKRERHERKHPDRERKRREPRRDVDGVEPVPRPSSPVPDRARRDRSYGGPEQQRRDEARAREQSPPPALHRVALPAVATKRERGTAQHDPDQHQRERDVQPDTELGECRRKAGEQQDDREDEPDVVRLPHGTDRVRDELALLCLTRTAREQVPNAAAEVRAREQYVGV